MRCVTNQQAVRDVSLTRCRICSTPALHDVYAGFADILRARICNSLQQIRQVTERMVRFYVSTSKQDTVLGHDLSGVLSVHCTEYALPALQW